MWMYASVSREQGSAIREKSSQNQRMIYWSMVFYAQAAICQLYSGDEYEMDDKMNMKWWWNEKLDETQGK